MRKWVFIGFVCAMTACGGGGQHSATADGGASGSGVTELTKTERRDLASSLFEIPAGYTETKN